MGRGRAKAKQTKVARELKYSTHETDLERLQRELAGSPDPKGDTATGDDVDDFDDDRWASSGR
ncbi:MAG: DUF3073 domain-containing protein [Actinomycetota bacterium]|nr:DUF3073 domain-containing protein [Actinomycetota bacterium]